MLEVLTAQLSDARSVEEKENRLREFLQILLLKIIFDIGYFKNLSFVGGTALRILYDLRRFSEDLDFCATNVKGYKFSEFAAGLERHLGNYAISAELKSRDHNTVQTIEVKFTDLLFKLGLTPHADKRLMVKLEIDSNPPDGARNELSLVNKTYVFTVTHYDLPSLFASKLHACFYRPYVKGRDFYDLIWYLGKKIEPNFVLLNNAISQTPGRGQTITPENFRAFLSSELSKVNFAPVAKDVERFLEDKEELKLLDREVILSILGSGR